MNTLKVFPNPWSCVSGGFPCGVVPKEPTSATDNPREFIGAKLDKARTVITRPEAKGELRNARQETHWVFLGLSDTELSAESITAKNPVDVPDTQYYRRAIARGELVLAGDGALEKLLKASGKGKPAPVVDEQPKHPVKAKASSGTSSSGNN